MHINYNLLKIQAITTFILFQLPYVEILENKLNTENNRESILLTIRKNDHFAAIFKQNSLKVSTYITELNSEKVDVNVFEVPYSKRKIQTIEIAPEAVEKIGKTHFELLINNVLVNKFSGSYLRGVSFELNLKA